MSVYRVITGTLRARTALHIGAGASNDLTDALLRRNGAGEPIIPGSALAGALRALLTRLAPRLGGDVCRALSDHQSERDEFCECAVCRLFGNLNPQGEPESRARASRLLIFDAVVQPPASTDDEDQSDEDASDGKAEQAQVQSDEDIAQSGEAGEQEQPPRRTLPTTIRDGVGIERASGAAGRASAAKFDLEVLPPGATAELRIELRGGDEQDENMLAAALAEWQAGRVWLGGRVARGLGAFDLEGLEYRTLDLAQPDQLMTFLSEDEPWEEAPADAGWLATRLNQVQVSASNAPTVARRWVSAEFTLQATGPLLAHDATAAGASGFDHAPLLANVGDWRRPVLPGASLRGVLRAQAERIARTLATLRYDAADFLKHCPACDPLARRLGETDEPPLESCDSLLKGVLKTTDEAQDKHLCLACRLFGSTQRGSRLIVEDARFAGAEPQYKMHDFLAIDRFTGGGAEHLKFDALALWQPAFRARVHLENPEDWELGWLALTVRDLRDGRLTLGGGAAKGFGCVRVNDDWKMEVGFLGDDDGLGLPVTGSSGVYQVAACNAQTRAQWLARANVWVTKFQEKLSAFERDALPHLPQDTYFGHVEHLYAKEVML